MLLSTGDECEIVGACVDGPCENGATCTQDGDQFQNYTCHCVEGWTGKINHEQLNIGIL